MTALFTQSILKQESVGIKQQLLDFMSLKRLWLRKGGIGRTAGADLRFQILILRSQVIELFFDVLDLLIGMLAAEQAKAALQFHLEFDLQRTFFFNEREIGSLA